MTELRFLRLQLLNTIQNPCLIVWIFIRNFSHDALCDKSWTYPNHFLLSGNMVIIHTNFPKKEDYFMDSSYILYGINNFLVWMKTDVSMRLVFTFYWK